MSEKTKISWCDSTVNFWSGCAKVSAGCANCYADARDKRMLQEPVRHFGKGAPRLKSKSAVKAALAMNRKPWICDKCGEASAKQNDCGCWSIENLVTSHRRRIMALSLGDIWDNEVTIEWLAEMLDTIRQCSDCIWILPSKRWENWLTRIEAVKKCAMTHPMFRVGGGTLAGWLDGWTGGLALHVPKNIIGLCSVENQETADRRIPKFLTVPLACRGLSMEPLLGPVDLKLIRVQDRTCTIKEAIDWIIIGGESGPNARPCNVEWIRRIAAQGKAAGVATFCKQLGSNPTCTGWDDVEFASNFDHRKGGDPSEWSPDLRMQQWPCGF